MPAKTPCQPHVTNQRPGLAPADSVLRSTRSLALQEMLSCHATEATTILCIHAQCAQFNHKDQHGTIRNISVVLGTSSGQWFPCRYTMSNYGPSGALRVETNSVGSREAPGVGTTPVGALAVGNLACSHSRTLPTSRFPSLAERAPLGDCLLYTSPVVPLCLTRMMCKVVVTHRLSDHPCKLSL